MVNQLLDYIRVSSWVKARHLDVNVFRTAVDRYLVVGKLRIKRKWSTYSKEELRVLERVERLNELNYCDRYKNRSWEYWSVQKYVVFWNVECKTSIGALLKRTEGMCKVNILSV